MTSLPLAAAAELCAAGCCGEVLLKLPKLGGCTELPSSFHRVFLVFLGV